MSVAPAPLQNLSEDEEKNIRIAEAAATSSNFGANGRVSPESMFPPIRGASPAPHPVGKIESPKSNEMQADCRIELGNIQQLGEPDDSQCEDQQNVSIKDQQPLVLSNQHLISQSVNKPQSPMATYMGQEGGDDQNNNKVEPFPGYRDADVVAAEEDEWSEYTYDSDEEKHKRNLFFGFLLMLLCCGLIIASIIIVYMVSTAEMKPTVIQNSFTKILNTNMQSSVSSGYVFTFSEGLIKEEAFVEVLIDIKDANQDGWKISLLDNNNNQDIKIEFLKSKKEVQVSNSDNSILKLTAVDEQVFKQGVNKLMFEATSVGYKVNVNEISLNDFNTSEDKGVELVKTSGFGNIQKVRIEALTGTIKSLVIGSTRYQ